jgi:hypothetical protein
MSEGLKEKELRQNCMKCGKGIFHISPLSPIFKISFQPFIANHQAIQRQAGLGMMLNPALAMVMGTNEDLAIPMEDKKTGLLCTECAARYTIEQLFNEE